MSGTRELHLPAGAPDPLARTLEALQGVVGDLATTTRGLQAAVQGIQDEQARMREFLAGDLGKGTGLQGEFRALQDAVKALQDTVKSLGEAIEKRRSAAAEHWLSAGIALVVSVCGAIASSFVQHLLAHR